MDYAHHTTANCSIEDFSTLFEGNSQSAGDPLEIASIDQLQCWLLELGYLQSEISSMKRSGMTIRDIARAAEDEGYQYRPLEHTLEYA